MFTLTSNSIGLQPGRQSGIWFSSRSVDGIAGLLLRLSAAGFDVGVPMSRSWMALVSARETIRAAAPVGDLGLVDFVTLVVGRRETGALPTAQSTSTRRPQIRQIK